MWVQLQCNNSVRGCQKETVGSFALCGGAAELPPSTGLCLKSHERKSSRPVLRELGPVPKTFLSHPKDPFSPFGERHAAPRTFSFKLWRFWTRRPRELTRSYLLSYSRLLRAQIRFFSLSRAPHTRFWALPIQKREFQEKEEEGRKRGER